MWAWHGLVLGHNHLRDHVRLLNKHVLVGLHLADGALLLKHVCSNLRNFRLVARKLVIRFLQQAHALVLSSILRKLSAY